MRIALDLMQIDHGTGGDYPHLVLRDGFGNSVELYVVGDPREAFIRLSGLGQAAVSMQAKLPATKRYEYR